MRVIVHEKFCRLIKVQGITLYPWVILRDQYSKSDLVLLNHEHIHIKQQKELWILPFYIFYLTHYLWNLLKYRDHYKAYRMICFEREAYDHEHDFTYPNRKKWGAAFRYLIS
ncbi:hypothetical protein [Sediminitomix flava]|uniref:BlaR1 peptidase M56 n=1 Tax=Sediminitomix flava TaxID=379075 RepID=A0A315Z5K3_SEDFL|nr:hypothetical protein [Sediminitomix flava]PWJ39188.1 hypothetical protein BC781_10689 [Sediminitomix flava]